MNATMVKAVDRRFWIQVEGSTIFVAAEAAYGNYVGQFMVFDVMEPAGFTQNHTWTVIINDIGTKLLGVGYALPDVNNTESMKNAIRHIMNYQSNDKNKQ